MTRRNIYILAIGIILMLLVTLTVPAIAEKDVETSTDTSAKVFDFGVDKKGGQGGGATEKVITPPHIAWVSYGPITQVGGSIDYYVAYGGNLGGKPVLVTGLSIPWGSPDYGNQQFSTHTETNYLYNTAAYVDVTSHDGKSLTGSYIQLIGIY